MQFFDFSLYLTKSYFTTIINEDEHLKKELKVYTNLTLVHVDLMKDQPLINQKMLLYKS